MDASNSKTNQPEGPAGIHTPRTDRFMDLIDDSEIDLGQVRSYMGQMETELAAAQAKIAELGLRYEHSETQHQQARIVIDQLKDKLKAAEERAQKAETDPLVAGRAALATPAPSRENLTKERGEICRAQTNGERDSQSVARSDGSPDVQSVRQSQETRLEFAERCFIAGAGSIDDRVSYDYALMRWKQSNLKMDLENE